MQLMQGTTVLRGPSTSDVVRCAVSPVERLELIREINRDRQLWASTKGLLIELSDFVNADTGLAWPSQRRLGSTLGIDRPNVNRALRQAEQHGYLQRVWVIHPGDKHPRLAYRLTFPGSAAATTPLYHPRHTPRVVGDTPPCVMDDTQTRLRENPANEPGPGVPGGSSPGTREPQKLTPSKPPTLGMLPDDWGPSEKAITNAMVELKLTREQVEHQTRQFRSYHRSKATRSADWLEHWWRFLDNVRPGGQQRWRVEPQAQRAGSRAPATNLDSAAALAAAAHVNGGWQ